MTFMQVLRIRSLILAKKGGTIAPLAEHGVGRWPMRKLKERKMKEQTASEMERLKRKIGELEDLVKRWEEANDPEAKWMLYLLKEAVEMGRSRLSRLARSF